MLDGTNYKKWAAAIRAFLRYSGCWALIEGYTPPTATTATPGISRPADSDATGQAAWDEKNQKAMGVIEMYTKENLKHLIEDKRTALAMWNTLKTEYEKPGAVGAFVAFQALFNAQLVDTSPLGPQLDALHEAAAQVTVAGIEIKDQLLALLMVNCLPKSYQTLASTILAVHKDVKDLKPSDVKPKIVEEEARRIANCTQISRVSSAPKKQTKPCEKCGRNNHTTEQHWDKKPSTGTGNSGNGNGNNQQGQQQGQGGKRRGKGKGNSNGQNTAQITVAPLEIVNVPDMAKVSEESISVSLYANGVIGASTEWMVDSGCTSHVTNQKSDFITYTEFRTPGAAHTAGKSQTIPILGAGTVVLHHLTDSGHKRYLLLTEVLYIPNANMRFFAPRIPVLRGHHWVIKGSQMTLMDDNGGKETVLASAHLREHEGLYFIRANIMNTVPLPRKDTPVVVAAIEPFDLWHERFGHAGKKAIEHLPGNVKGVPQRLKAPADSSPCEGCELGKSRRDPFPPSDSRTEHPLDLVHMDLVEYPSLSIDGYKYAMTTLDDHSSFGVAWYLKRKSDALSCFKRYKAWAETQTERKLKCIRSDRGGEFFGRDFDEFLAEHGIERQQSVARSPQQNGRAERWQQTIANKAEAMRHHAGLSSGFWKLASEAAVHIYNRQPLRRLKWKPPITAWDGTVPDVSYFRVFGCKAYVHVHKDARQNKLQPKAKVMVFVGYEPGSKGYRFWDKNSRSIVVSRDVTFDEKSFPNKEPQASQADDPDDAAPPFRNPTPEPDTDPDQNLPDVLPDEAPHPRPDNALSDSDSDLEDLYQDPRPQPPPRQHSPEPVPRAEPQPPPVQPRYPRYPSPPRMARRRRRSSPSPERRSYRDQSQPRQDPRRPDTPENREEHRRAREWLRDHGPFQPQAPAPPPPEPVPDHPHQRPRRQNAGQRRVPDNSYGDVPPTEAWRQQERDIRRDQREARQRAEENQQWRESVPIPSDDSSSSHGGSEADIETDPDYPMSGTLSGSYRELLMHATQVDPQTYKEAMSRPDAKQWEIAMQEELKSHEENKTWILVTRPRNRRTVKCKWVFVIKADGRYKARLVAKGFTQVQGIDFQETFSPVARYEAIRFLLAHAALENWEIEAMDIKTAFLYGELDEEIYMEQPEGFVEKGKEHMVCKLQKAIYGLKQASRTWNQKLHQTLIGIGFARTRSDAGVYVYEQKKGHMILIVYVDDLLPMGPSKSEIDRVKKVLADKFQMRDLGPADTFLGMRITRDRSKRQLELDQQNYIEQVLTRFQMHNAKPQKTPLPEGLHLEKAEDGYKANATLLHQYQTIIGSLIYCMIGSRPDIAFAVTRLSQYMSNPTPTHVEHAKHVLRYLRATSDYRIRFQGSGQSGLIGYSDADWGENRDNRRSTTGYTFLMADAAVTWVSRMQRTVARSSTEAEYMALSDACSEIAWLTSLQREIGFPQEGPVPMVSDNQGGIFLAINPAHDRRLKHVDIRYHFIREFVEDNRVEIVYISTDDMIADILTKPLGAKKHEKFRKALGLVSSKDL